MATYVCAECGERVDVLSNGEIVKHCDCQGAIIGQISSDLTGNGGVNP